MDDIVGRDPSGARLAALDLATCLALLRSADVARIGVVDTDGCPVVLPVSCALVEADGGPCIVVRTRPGNVLDRPDTPACIEIDGVDPGHDGGWSVLVRGLLRPIRADDAIDPHPLLASGRDSWLLLEPTVISGRRLIASPMRWAFHPTAYI
jgi:hypothetical protein